MTRVYPFRAHRYAQSEVGSLDLVVTQPYDKITAEMRESYLARHPQNIVRVVKNPDYAEAGRCLRDWIDLGILRRDEVPAFYPCEQTFDFEDRSWSRLGLIGVVCLDEAQAEIMGHERVLRAPLEDRLSLIRETEANEGLIFTLFSDPARSVDDALRAWTDVRRPDAEVFDEYGVRHRLWRMTEADAQARLQALLADKPLYIADGHHRFQTSVAFNEECHEKGWRPAAPESFDKRTVALFNMDDPALKILPTHRAISGLSGVEPEKLLSQLAARFLIRNLQDASTIGQALRGPGRRIGLAVAGESGGYLLQVAPEALQDPTFMPAVEFPARALDVNILHEGILMPHLGIGPEELSSQKYVDYYRGANELLERLRRGEYQMAFFLNPTPVEQVREISEKGEKMPQKSTDFYPKLLTGLVIMKMEIDRSARLV